LSSFTTTQEREFTQMVPWWGWVLAVVAFFGMPSMMYAWAPHDHRSPLTFVWMFIAGAFFGFYMLVVGYVSRDAKRRGMSPALWIFILLCLIESGVGFLVYFLLREPLVNSCPNCRQRVEAGYNFCPNCRCALSPCCVSCKRALQEGDRYCPYCATEQDETVGAPR